MIPIKQNQNRSGKNQYNQDTIEFLRQSKVNHILLSGVNILLTKEAVGDVQCVLYDANS